LLPEVTGLGSAFLFCFDAFVFLVSLASTVSLVAFPLVSLVAFPLVSLVALGAAAPEFAAAFFLVEAAVGAVSSFD